MVERYTSIINKNSEQRDNIKVAVSDADCVLDDL